MPDDVALLTARLDRAYRRAADATPGSPDWDAAMALVEDLERRVADLSERVPEFARDDAGVPTAVAL